MSVVPLRLKQQLRPKQPPRPMPRLYRIRPASRSTPLPDGREWEPGEVPSKISLEITRLTDRKIQVLAMERDWQDTDEYAGPLFLAAQRFDDDEDMQESEEPTDPNVICLAREELRKFRESFDESVPADATAIKATTYAWPDCQSIPPREWLYGRHFIRGFVSVTGASGGIGKSSLTIAECLSMVSGRALLHGIKPVFPLNVWVWNGEDPLVELNRRIAATAKHYGIGREDCKGRLFVDSGRDTKIVIAKTIKGGVEIARPVVEAIKARIKENKIDVLVIDPFVSSHRAQENDNTAIDEIAREWSDIAEHTGCAIELVHHVRKVGDLEVTVEAMRGASALVSAARSARVLNQMTVDESKKAGVDNRRAYFRVNNGKSNMSPAPENATWFHMQSVDLENGGPYEEGDSIGVVTDWKWPDPLDDITVDDLRAVQAAVDGDSWRADARAKNWVGRAVADVLGLDPEDEQAKSKIKGLLKVWVKNGALIEVESKDDQRKVRTFVKCGRDPQSDDEIFDPEAVR